MAKRPPPPFPAYQGNEPYLFASYAHKDSALVFPELLRLHQLGYRIWYDEGINPGEEWPAAIQKAHHGAHLVLAFVSPRFVASKHCRREVNLADKHDKPLVAVYLEPTELLHGLDYLLEGIQGIPQHALTESVYHEQLDQGLPRALCDGRAPPPPLPCYRDAFIRALAERAAALRERRRQLVATGADAAALRDLDQQELDLKRQLRDGPQLVAGYCLSDRYLLLERLGAGGFATVWKAYDETLRTEVAVKVLHGQHTENAERLARFRRGARAMHKWPHPHVVRIREPYREDGGYHYFVMEYVPGGNLSQAVRNGSLSPKALSRLLLQTGKALAHAHCHGAVHRDVTPDNILLDATGAAQLTDFDLVLLDDSTGASVAGQGMGKFTYAAPECVQSADRATARSDIYSLAMTAVFAWHGRAFDTDGFSERVALVRELNCPSRLQEVLIKALQRDPAKRYATMQEFCAAYREAVTPLSAPATEVASRATPPRPQIGTVITNSIGMQFAWVPPGQSWLGGGGGKPGTNPFTLAEGLWCGVYPVTQAEWEAVMGTNPSLFQGHPRYPVECVSWNDVQEFLKKLNEIMSGDGFLYRLPTEQEWEYICRGGPLSSQEQSAYHFYFAKSKDDLTPSPINELSHDQANFGYKLGHPSDVGSHLPNPLGIYDMHGNVWEWTSSLWKEGGPDRVIRGGGWRYLGVGCRASYRRGYEPEGSDSFVGFRVLAVPALLEPSPVQSGA